MNTNKKIFLGLGIVGTVVGGFLLAKYLTRNVKNYDYLKETIVTYKEAPISSEDIQ